MIHPRLSINALSSAHWSFDQDLALWRELGVRHAGLLMAKLAPSPSACLGQLTDAGIQPSAFVCGPFALDEPARWDDARVEIALAIDLAARAGSGTVYLPPGRTTGAAWAEVLELFAEAIAPMVALARRRQVRLAIEPSLRTDFSFVNTLRDALHVAGRTGVGIVVDFGNCWAERDVEKVVRASGATIALVQICDIVVGRPGAPGPGGRVNPGDGDLPVARLLRACVEAGYAGPFDLEVLGPAVEREGYAAAVPRGCDQASIYLSSAGA